MNAPLRTNDARLLARMILSLKERQLTPAEIDTALMSAERLASGVEFAYGLLWLGVDSENPRRPPPGYERLCSNAARSALLNCLDRAGQARGIDEARTYTTGDAHD